MNPLFDEPREYVTGMPEHIIGGVIRALETVGAAMEIAGATESPIEEMFGGALTAELRRRYTPEQFGIYNPSEPSEHPSGCMMLIAQFDLLRFRYDFAMRVQGFPRPFLLVECDGKQFHSSPEQMANDRRKDECAFKHAIPLIRFTGGDIHYRIEKCVAQVVQFLEEMK
jgi:very-short-patch-repair endonuclease